MPCFTHDGYQELPLPRGTTVLLDGDPPRDESPVLAYFWGPSDGQCDGHDAPAQSDIVIKHQATLTKDVRRFVSTDVCRRMVGGAREILYVFTASGAYVEDVSPGTLDCD